MDGSVVCCWVTNLVCNQVPGSTQPGHPSTVRYNQKPENKRTHHMILTLHLCSHNVIWCLMDGYKNKDKCHSIGHCGSVRLLFLYALCYSAVRPSVHCPFNCCPLSTISFDVISLYLVKEFQWNLPQIFITWVGIADKVFKVRGQRSRSYVNNCVTAIMAKVYISMLRLSCLLQLQSQQ